MRAAPNSTSMIRGAHGVDTATWIAQLIWLGVVFFVIGLMLVGVAQAFGQAGCRIHHLDGDVRYVLAEGCERRDPARGWVAIP